MAVFTSISFNEMATIAARLSLGELQKFEEVQAGAENSSFWAETTKGKWFVSLVERFYSAAHSNWQATLMHFLESSGIPVPAPVLLENRQLPFVKDKPLFVVPFIEGTHPQFSVLDNKLLEQTKAAGLVLGKIHSSSLNYHPTFSSWISAEQIFSDWSLLQTEYEGKKASYKDATTNLNMLWEEGRDAVEALRTRWSKVRENVSQLPVSALHGDYFADNIIYSEQDVIAVLDFPYASTGPVVSDLAIALSAWAFNSSGKYCQDQFDYFLKGYEKSYSLSESECSYLPIFCELASTRFFITRLRNLFGELKTGYHPKDPLDYLKRLQFFQNLENN